MPYRKNQIIILFTIFLSMILNVSCAKSNSIKQIEAQNNVTPSAHKISISNSINESIPSMPSDGIELNDKTVFIHGKELQCGLYTLTNRYYIPLGKFLDTLGATYTLNEKNFIITKKEKQYIINTESQEYIKENVTYKLKKTLYKVDDTIYMNLFDFCMIFNLKTKWDYDNNHIYLYKRHNKLESNVQKNPNAKPALIRLEDIAPDPRIKAIELEKLRIISDYLYSEDIKFHIAWVPRYINPKSNIDNDPSGNNTMFNTDFVYTLDYMINNGGLIGLHGYTHQYGSSASIDGIEFHTTYKKDSIPATKEYAEDRIKNAIASSKKLDIPYYFFEVPHYAATPLQFSVMEKYFGILYEPYTPDGLKELNTKIYTKDNGDSKTKYIPTPLDCLNGKKDLNSLISRIDKLKDGYPASFFFHPYLEYEFINLNDTQNGYSEFEYSQDSNLHKIINAIRSKGYEFKTINEL